MTPIKIELTNPEMVIAAAVGAMRRIMNIRDGNKPRNGFEESNWLVDIDAACAELAVANHTKQYWNGAIGNIKAHDVGELQVRHTPRENGCLIVHDYDHDSIPYILVTGTAPTFIIRGWLICSDGKKKEHWRTNVPNPAYFVAQRYLRDFSELKW